MIKTYNTVVIFLIRFITCVLSIFLLAIGIIIKIIGIIIKIIENIIKVSSVIVKKSGKLLTDIENEAEQIMILNKSLF